MSTEPRDVFISHASEDKVEVAAPLVELLNRARVSTWYDTVELKIGDSLLEKIDEGLGTSRFGAVILSEHFFAKQWPRRELDGLFSRLTSDNKFRILPVWHEVTVQQVRDFSPILAGQVGVPTSLGLEHVASKIREAVFRKGDPAVPHGYAQVHTMKTFRLTEIPRARGWIEHQYFFRCHFTGPAVLTVDTDTTMSECRFMFPEQFFPIQSDRGYTGMIGARHTAFVECTFDETVGIAIADTQWEKMQTEITNMTR